MHKQTFKKIIKLNRRGTLDVKRLNVSTDYNKAPAMKMYKQMGFKLTYTYPQAFLPCSVS